MNQRNVESMDVDFTTFEGHPILIGRIAAVQMLNCELHDLKRVDIFQKLKELFVNEKVKRIDYFYEINIVSLILSDFRLMEMLGKTQSGPHITQQYQINHNQLSNLVSLMLSISMGNQKEITKLTNRVNKDLWVTSYLEFFNLFYLIALFHTTDDLRKREKYKEEYLCISDKMNYQKFNEEYLKNYFV